MQLLQKVRRQWIEATIDGVEEGAVLAVSLRQIVGTAASDEYVRRFGVLRLRNLDIDPAVAPSYRQCCSLIAWTYDPAVGVVPAIRKQMEARLVFEVLNTGAGLLAPAGLRSRWINRKIKPGSPDSLALRALHYHERVLPVEGWNPFPVRPLC